MDAGVKLRLTVEQLPTEKSAVIIRTDSDEYQMKNIDVHWAVDGRELGTMREFAVTVAEYLENSGLAKVHIDKKLMNSDSAFLESIEDGFHQMGGARMSQNSDGGVVDADLKVHGTKNLYVAGAAVYPCAGFSNPTLTAISLGLRLAGHLKNQAEVSRGLVSNR